jgi:hypothetical protein
MPKRLRMRMRESEKLETDEFPGDGRRRVKEKKI